MALVNNLSSRSNQWVNSTLGGGSTIGINPYQNGLGGMQIVNVPYTQLTTPALDLTQNSLETLEDFMTLTTRERGRLANQQFDVEITREQAEHLSKLATPPGVQPAIATHLFGYKLIIK